MAIDMTARFTEVLYPETLALWSSSSIQGWHQREVFEMDDQVVNTWQIHNRINLYLLDAIKPEALSSVTATSKIRSVARMFAHMHNVRLMWLKTSAPELLGEIEKIEPSEAAHDKQRLRRSLE